MEFASAASACFLTLAARIQFLQIAKQTANMFMVTVQFYNILQLILWL